MSASPLYIGNDMLITLDEFWNEQVDAYDNGATVTVTIMEKDGVTEVSGVVWPVSMPYVSSSDGKYEGAVDKAMALTENEEYRVQITATSGSLDSFWDIPAIAARRVS